MINNNLLNKAIANFNCAKLIRENIEDNDELINLVGYHLQQAVEILIKYLLKEKGVEYPKTHKIEDLLKIAKENINDFHIDKYLDDKSVLLSSWEKNRNVIGFLANVKDIDEAIIRLEKTLNYHVSF